MTMKRLNIAAVDKNFTLESVPEKYEFIQKIAKQYSSSKKELEVYFQTGLITYKELETSHSKEYVEKVALWTIRQAIIEKASEL